MLQYENPKKLLQPIDDLVTSLSEEERTTFGKIIRNSQIKPEDLDKYTSWSEDCYTRNCIANNEKYELILICWCKGHQTPIHDHGGEECWVKVISGEFEEDIYKQDADKRLMKVKSSISKRGEVTYMKDFMGFHRLKNMANEKSMTLHLYAKPIRKCNIFDEELNTFVPKEMSYHTTF